MLLKFGTWMHCGSTDGTETTKYCKKNPLPRSNLRRHMPAKFDILNLQ